MKVTTVEIKDVGIPQGMQRAMARQAEAERERRAKVINAEGEFQASERLYDAAQIMSAQPDRAAAALPADAARDRLQPDSTIVFPLPIDLLKPLMQSFEDGAARRDRARERDRLGAAQAHARARRGRGQVQLPDPDDTRISRQGGRRLDRVGRTP